MARDQRPGRIISRGPAITPAAASRRLAEVEPVPLPITVPPRSALSSAGWATLLVCLSFSAVAGGLVAALMVVNGIG